MSETYAIHAAQKSNMCNVEERLPTSKPLLQNTYHLGPDRRAALSVLTYTFPSSPFNATRNAMSLRQARKRYSVSSLLTYYKTRLLGTTQLPSHSQSTTAFTRCTRKFTKLSRPTKMREDRDLVYTSLFSRCSLLTSRLLPNRHGIDTFSHFQ